VTMCPEKAYYATPDSLSPGHMQHTQLLPLDSAMMQLQLSRSGYTTTHTLKLTVNLI